MMPALLTLSVGGAVDMRGMDAGGLMATLDPSGRLGDGLRAVIMRVDDLLDDLRSAPMYSTAGGVDGSAPTSGLPVFELDRSAPAWPEDEPLSR
jgi:hypothetical protein